MAYTQVASTQTDADSPIDEDLMDLLRTNFDHVVASDGTPATDWVDQGGIAANAVGTGELKISTASGTIACGAAATVVNIGTGYAHHARFFATYVGGTLSGFRTGKITTATATLDGEYLSTDGNGSSPNPTTYNYEARHHAACPPHEPFQGCGEWGMFAFIMRLKASGLELAAWLAESPPWNMDDHRFSKDDPEALEGFQPPLWIDVPRVLQEVAAGEMVGASPGDESEGVELVMIDTRSICLVETTFCPVQERAAIALAKAAEITDDVIRDAPEGARRQYLLDKRGRLLAQAERPAVIAAALAEAETAHAAALVARRTAKEAADEAIMRWHPTREDKTPEAVELRRQAKAATKAALHARRAELDATDALGAARKASPQPMKARDALIKRAPLHGLTPWELLKREHPEVTVATAVALENGQPIRSGVPDFDENMVILRP